MKITDYKIRIIDKKEVLASFEINFEYLITIKEIVLCRGKDGKENYILMPSKQFPDKETGEMKYKPQVLLSDGLTAYLRKFCDDLYTRESKERCS